MSERPLWAPWRIEYITGPKDAECVFCAAAQGGGDDAHRVVARSERCFAILNRYPYAPGHVMVAPNRHVAELDQLDDSESLQLMQHARRMVAGLTEAMAPQGFNVGLNLGAVAGAGIADHLHLHVVPRWGGDTNFMPLIANTHVIPQALEATQEALLAALSRLS